MKPLRTIPYAQTAFLPNLKGLGAQKPIVDRLEQLAAETKQILREPMKREKPLSLTR